MNNGVTMCLSLRREGKMRVVDVKRSGTYKSFSDLCDCNTAVTVKYRQSMYKVPTAMHVNQATFRYHLVSVGLMRLLDP